MFSKSNSTHRVKATNPYLPVSLIGFVLMFFALAAQGQQVHQLLYNNASWADQNLSGASTDLHTGVAAFLTTPNNGLHTYYLASDDDVHQLYLPGTTWVEEDLTLTASAPKAIAGSAVAGFSVQNFQYVYFVAQNQHVHQLLYNNSTWIDSDLTAAVGGTLISPTNQLTAVLTGTSGLHVYYVASSGHMQQLYNVNGNWQIQDLTVVSGGPLANPNGMSAVVIANFQYVFYVANTGHVHELTYNNTTWVDADLTGLSKSLPSAGGSGVTAMVIPGSTKLRVFTIANNDHMLQLGSGNNKAWTSSDLTKLAKAPLANPANGTVAFATTPNNQLHVYYLSGNHVNQLFLPTPATKWQNQDLTNLALAPPASGTSGMAGFSLQNFQYVFYVGN